MVGTEGYYHRRIINGRRIIAIIIYMTQKLCSGVLFFPILRDFYYYTEHKVTKNMFGGGWRN